jgi:hypothetical protein
MSERIRIVRLALWCVAVAIASNSALAQASAGQDEDSCRRFAQAFYEWYAPLTQNRRLKTAASDVALRQKPDLFAPDLFRALKADSDAQAKTPDDIVGLDFDPFVGSQDPAKRYRAERTTVQGNKCSVEVREVTSNGKVATSGKPEVVAELIRAGGRWQFTDFSYPELNASLMKVLSQLADDRRKYHVP